MATVSVGDKVLYSPDTCHFSTVHPRDGRLFYFRHLEKGARNLGDGNGPVHHKAGDVVRDHAQEGLRLTRVGGVLHTHDGHAVEVGDPKSYWPAVVVAVNEDGTADLDIEHPVQGITLHCPDRGHHPEAKGIPHDSGKKAHTFHLPGE